jgi:hypothetical protein
MLLALFQTLELLFAAAADADFAADDVQRVLRTAVDKQQQQQQQQHQNVSFWSKLGVPACVVLMHNFAHHASHVTRHTSHVTCHTSHVTRHTSHVTRHTSHVTPQERSLIFSHVPMAAQVVGIRVYPANEAAKLYPRPFTQYRCPFQIQRRAARGVRVALLKQLSCTKTRVLCRFRGRLMDWDRSPFVMFFMSVLPWYSLQPPPPPPPPSESLMQLLMRDDV